jgi:DNA invertase Pin-like site-specific DNA recombinase
MTQKALIYCRVSSKKQSEGGSGLTSQEKRCRQHAMQRGYIVDKVFPDDVTGGGNFTKRKGMVSLLEHVNANPDTSFVVIFDDLKRLARDTKYYLILRETLDALGVRVECLNFNFEDTPEGEFYETVIAAGGQLERKQGARQVRQKIRARFEAGYWGTNPPLGYKMQNERGKPRILVRKEPIASYIQEALEGYARGRFETQMEIKRFLDNCPEFPKNLNRGNEVHPDTIRKMLTNVVYAGMVSMPSWGITPRQGHHEALIDKKTFKINQERLAGKSYAATRKDLAQDFPLRGAVCCADCGSPLTANWTSGRSKKYPYYWCYNKECVSYSKSIRRADIEGEFETLLTKLSPAQEIIKTSKRMFKQQWGLMGEKLKNDASAIDEQIRQLDTQKTKVVDKLIDSNNKDVIKACEQRLEKIEMDKLLLEEKKQQNSKPQADFEKSFRTALTFLSNPHKLWASRNYEHKRAVLKMSFSQHLIYKRKEGFRTVPASSPFRLLGNLTGQESKLVGTRGFEPPTPCTP